MRFSILAMLALTPPFLQAYGQPASGTQVGSEPHKSVTIVELFTSEGCSSCPPADALLAQVHLKKTTSGQLIVGISEHVTYWDRLGWRDPFSNEIFTERQNVYADRFLQQGPYTPQMVVNGREQFVGSDVAALQQALQTEAKYSRAELKIVSFRRDSDAAYLTFSLSGSQSKALDIVAVVTDDIDSSKVSRGENAGRALKHVSVARKLMRIATVRSDGELSVRLPSYATPHSDPTSGQHLIVFAQERHQGVILGAAEVSL